MREIKQLEEELNKEYEKVGTITIKKAHEDTISLSKIQYSGDIMNVISPLDNPKPIIVYKNYYDKYTIVDGYHRTKDKILKGEQNIGVIVLDEYNLSRKNDTLFSFLEELKGETIKFINDELLLVNDKYYEIESNEGCGGCSNGWSSINVLSEFIGKEIKIKTIDNISENDNSDKYKLNINGKIIADVDTGWGNGYYGGDFKINLIN